ncbi:sigma-54 dependent transcriptional regulator [Burkholderia dolosa]|uniref:Sigma-54-dependent Fis family transcriptional regulator n=2 Tax=Burkholderia TaxID=32008 RepID=A0A892IDU8_9BURK|nr:sigma-54 dependent transcriptional regulator [Burkholderia dolosa]AKE05908.1 Fis family transcriptional regulator [Burkholderia cepacia]PRE40167.1 sigma-54-dependent Fis family transcriptional regulator [Burkholderia sp. AU12872]PUA76074.1 sigma-54-dependent Fis family transcriptional regulator [Burkholderia sp. AU29985]AYZ93761.1 sigma-54-dependent Fis family transcriptional regulator [Burkholderia dolosa]EAY70511.1 Response regulator [Burkholderia dolosa AU0158]
MINIATSNRRVANFQNGALIPMGESANRSKQRADGRRLSGRSAAMRTLLSRIEKIAPTGASVMIAGESGVGKDIVARRLHELSERRNGPFIAVNCGAIPADIAESQLFGHEKGSFTGAIAQREGFFEAARGGTLLFDEIAEMPAALQVKLLRALESNTIMRVGGTETIPLDVRIVSATRHNPAEAVRDGRLREDLFYRLAAFALYVPPLRQREGDVETIAQEFVDALNARHRSHKRLTDAAIAALRAYSWPGNVRELRNTIERAYILADERIDVTLPKETAQPEITSDNAMALPLGATLHHAQQHFIAATLRHFDGNKPRAAKALGISLKTLYNRLALMRDNEPGGSS